MAFPGVDESCRVEELKADEYWMLVSNVHRDDAAVQRLK
jgi:hypothetical protein